MFCIVALTEILKQSGGKGGSYYENCLDFGYQPFLDGVIQGTPGKMLMERDVHKLTEREEESAPPTLPVLSM